MFKSHIEISYYSFGRMECTARVSEKCALGNAIPNLVLNGPRRTPSTGNSTKLVQILLFTNEMAKKV